MIDIHKDTHNYFFIFLIGVKKIIFVLFVFCIAFSCRKQTENSLDVIKIDVDMKASVKQPIETFFSAIEVVPLETTEESLLKKCGKVIFNNDKYYILDEGQHVIFVFDKHGHFIRSSKHKQGRGPGEYGTIMDFDFNPQTGYIEILDVSSYKIRRYDEDFNFINEFIYPKTMYNASFFSTFKAITSDLLVFYSSSGPVRDKDVLLLYSTSKNELIKRVEIQSIKHRLGITQEYSFYMRDSALFFTNKYPNNDIYQILYNEEEIKRVVEFHFGEHTFCISDMSERSFENGNFIEMNNDRFAFPQAKYENDSSYFSIVYFKNELHLVTYNKKTKQTKVVPCKFSNGGMILPPKFVDNTYFYVIAEPDWIEMMIVKDLLDIQSQEIIETLKEDDNPVLLKYKLVYK